MRTYDWTRFWCLREGSLMRSRGYLWVFPGITKDIVTFDEISNVPCLALLGEPGIGKSYALQTEVEKLELKLASNPGERVLFFNLRSYSNDARLVHEIFENETIDQWLSGSHKLHLFLDSLDEGLLRIDTLTALLVDKLKTLPNDRLNVRVACRTAEWSPFLETNLKKLWGEDNFKAYELVSLQESDVSTAATIEELDAEHFLSEVAVKGAEPLAAKPVTLRLLLNLFRPPNVLPRTQSELYERGCLLLCEEESEGRKTKWKLTARQRFRVAARIAAITIFSNKASIWVGNDTGEQSDSDVMVSDIAGGFEKDVDGIEFHVTEEAVRETVSATGLFTSRGLNRLGWQHQTYAEFLASWYFDSLNLDHEVILLVLRGLDDAEGLLVPQLYETAAWIANQRPEIFQILMQTEPLVLLRSDVLSADDVVRSELTAALLSVFEEEREFDRWEIRSYFSKLKHAHLAEQLRPYLEDKSKGFLVRRVAMDIAEECEVTALQNILVHIALDQNEQPATRASAAGAICEIGDSETKAKLKPLAIGTAGEDPESELKGYGLMCVWPDHMTATELFNTLTDAPNLYGSYKSFLNRGLVGGLKTEDLPIALDWVKKAIKDKGVFDFDRKSLSSEIIVKAWEALDDERVLDSFVQVVIEKIKHYDELLEEYDTRDKLLEMRQDTVRRTRLLRRVLPLLTERADWFGFGHSIVLRLGNEDVPLLLDELVTTEDVRTRDTLFSILKDFLNSWDGVAPEVLSEIHSALELSDPLKNELSVFFEPIILDSPKAQAAREVYEQSFASRRSEKALEAEKPLTPSPSERVLIMLDKFEHGNVDAWWQLNLEMTLDTGSKFYGDELEIDLRKLPGWITASESIQRRIIEAAKRYVMVGDPKTEEWIGTNTLYRPAFSGYRALWLVRSTDPAFVENLSTDVWRKWAPIIFHYPIYNGRGEEVYTVHRQFLGTAYRVVPDEIISLILGEIDRFGAPNSFVDFDRLGECWDEILLAALRHKVLETDLNPQMFRRILSLLIEHNDSEAVAFAHQLLTLPIPLDDAAQERAMVAATSMLLHEDDAGWDSVWPAIESNLEFGRKVIEGALSPYSRRHIANQLSEAQIADLYVWLSANYPHSEDPQFPSGIAHLVGTREEIAQLRDSLLSHLKGRGTRQSVQAIEKIANALPYLDWLKWTLLEARKNMRRHSWKPLLPSEIIGLSLSSGKLLLAKMSSTGTGAERITASLTLWSRPVDEIANLSALLTSFRSVSDGFIFFVGAGLSFPVFPLWDGLLLRMVNRCDSKKLLSSIERDELVGQLNQKKELLSIAAYCVEKLGKFEYRAFLEAEFSKDIDIGKLEAYQELFKLRPGIIITTNFDQVPERLNGSSLSLDSTSASSDSGHYKIFVNPNVAEAGNSLKAGERVFFKMHGCISNQASVVFTYEDFRREIYTGRAKEFLKAIFNTRTVIFIGFGFSDPHVESILNILQETNSGLASPHYVLTHDLSGFQKHTLEHKYGVRVINYISSDGHPQVAEFLRFLRGFVA